MLPMASLVMAGRMIKNMRHALVIYGVMTTMFLGMLVWAIYWDTYQPNPALTEQKDQVYPLNAPQKDGPDKPSWMVAHPSRSADLEDRDPTKGGKDKPQPAVVPGLPVDQAAVEGARGRLRPILMTSCAMLAGMVPMALVFGEGGVQTAPLARAVIGGLVAATLATLLILPTVFATVQGRRPARSASLDPDDPESAYHDAPGAPSTPLLNPQHP